ncbi:thymidine phosphorylase [Palleronia pelagia]|uniref:thymidine phosphorylase n=1 Tax=Palleronia pelagia TaxID=387096 RepID=A0A1H8K6Q9_9RHOB|nr:thymidine phosphorylase [Palleronia pelagia]SEN88156.1 thymidine phosphorylase [Palleronia pelagia]
MSVRDTLAILRRGDVPAAADLAAFAAGLADGRVTDAQAGAFAMGVCRGPGLGEAGRVALTAGMADSGDRLTWDLPGPVVDKHSTGGVGDPVSLILAPALAALGGFVPMISGRGLGHTGGTLDKLEAIPGLSVALDHDAFERVVRDTGSAIVAASRAIAPADKRLYAIRDVTATVDQVDLICASILSKKLAAGLGALVLDVKCGSGAFMRDPAAARDLARVLVETATGAGLPTRALITAMDQPLAPAMGNATEIRAVMAVLDGRATDSRLAHVTAALGGELLHMAGLADSREDGAARISEAITDGRAMERFAAMVAGQGGPSDFAATWDEVLPRAPVIRDIPAPTDGYLAKADGTALGQAVVALGGGRARDGDAIDPSVGLDAIAPLGARLAKGDPLARVHAADEAAADRAAAAVVAALTLSDKAPDATTLIAERIA